MSPDGAYPLVTARLVIEPLVQSDVAEFVAYRQDPVVARWQSWDPGYSLVDGRNLTSGQPATDLPAAGEWLQLAVRNVTRSTLFGDVAVQCLPDQPATFEIGMTLARKAQGRGIATEAVSRVLVHLFAAVGAHRVVAHCDAENAAVAKVLRRVGMRQESRQLEGDFFKGHWSTLDSYAILAREHTGRRETSD